MGIKITGLYGMFALSVCICIILNCIHVKHIKLVLNCFVGKNIIDKSKEPSVILNASSTDAASEVYNLKTSNIRIVIPFRTTNKEYSLFMKHLKEHNRRNWNVTVYMITKNQSDYQGYGWLLNIGILQAIKDGKADCVITHNVNILVNKNVDYASCEKPRQVCFESKCVNNKMYYPLSSGVIIAKPVHWKKINGFSNKDLTIENEYKNLLTRFRINNFTDLNGVVHPDRNYGICHCIYEKDHNESSKYSTRQYNDIELTNDSLNGWENDGLNSLQYNILEHSLDKQQNIWITVTGKKCTALLFGHKCVNVTTPYFRKQLLVGVLSAYNNYEKRQSIRKTWKRFKGNWDLGFLIGLPFDEKAKGENRTYGDLILVHQQDQYHGALSILPLKTATLYWIARKFGSEWILKTDDDSFVDIPRIINVTKKSSKPFYGGQILRNYAPARNPKSISYVSSEQWKGGIFPDFASGAGYLMSGSLMECFNRNIYKAYQMPREDVFSGILANQCKVIPKQIDGMTDFSYSKADAEKAIIQHRVNTQKHMNKIWNKKKDI